jgi:arylsulfatase A-like enzyme
MSKNKGPDSTRRPKQPNFLFIIVDEKRYPTVYENEELKTWRKENLITEELLRKNGMTFLNHYIGSTACSPSRTTLLTGQYPSLHGVTQTTGAAKGAFDPDVFWLDSNTVPTLGNYFKAAGYRTYWKGKWHLSDEDILIPGTHDALPSYHTKNGVPDLTKERLYKNSNRLKSYGFDGWIGPEPHGSDPRNSGSSASFGLSGRDEVYASEVVNLIQKLEKTKDKNNQPWMIVSSFVNPHDITLYGLITHLLPNFKFNVDRSLPSIPPSPTAHEDLTTKPDAQLSYRDVYQKALQPTRDTEFYRQLYYSLQKEVDNQMFKVFQALKDSIFSDDTIIVFTSDHGSLVGAHGGLFQKWHNIYEKTLHVPFIIHYPKLFPQAKETHMITSHLDVLPTLLGLANINPNCIQEKLKKTHTEVHPFVGRDLTPLIKNTDIPNEPIYFMTDDEFSRGLNQYTLAGHYYPSVIQPNHIEAIIVKLPTGNNNEMETWKLARYFDNPQFWSNPGVEDVITTPKTTMEIDNQEVALSIVNTKTQPVLDQFELYNLTQDSLEKRNLAHPSYETEKSKMIMSLLQDMLIEQRNQKRLTPTN